MTNRVLLGVTQSQIPDDNDGDDGYKDYKYETI